MEVIIQSTSQEASVLGAKVLAALIRKKPRCVLGLATGSTPLALYQELIRMHREEGLDFSGVTTFNLDEYLGLAPDHPASYHHFMQENLFRHINVQPRHVHIPDGLTRDVPTFCAAYERSIADAGGIDAQILGLGSDGHIGFNEPSSSLASRTRIKTLTPRTRQDNARFFSRLEDVPQHVVTMGVGTIMDARSILLFAFGGGKAEAIQQSVEGPITANVPGSILQMHPAAQAFLDEGSAGKLARADYYRWVYDHKPAWQKIG